MNYSDFRFTMDIQIHQSQVSVPATFGDSARRLCIGLIDGSKPYVIGEGCRAVFNAKKPDGNNIKNDCIIERNVILYEFTEQTTNAEGIVYCDITLYDTDGKVLTSPQFIIVVDKRVVRNQEVPISEDDYTALDNIFARDTQLQTNEGQRLVAEGSIDTNSEYYGGRALAEKRRADAETQRGNTFNAKMTEWDEEFAYSEEHRERTYIENEETRTANDVARNKKIAEIETLVGDIGLALDELHNYAQALIGGGEV